MNRRYRRRRCSRILLHIDLISTPQWNTCEQNMCVCVTCVWKSLVRLWFFFGDLGATYICETFPLFFYLLFQQNLGKEKVPLWSQRPPLQRLRMLEFWRRKKKRSLKMEVKNLKYKTAWKWGAASVLLKFSWSAINRGDIRHFLGQRES